jgi:hypothetical protein
MKAEEIHYYFHLVRVLYIENYLNLIEIILILAQELFDNLLTWVYDENVQVKWDYILGLKFE